MISMNKAIVVTPTIVPDDGPTNLVGNRLDTQFLAVEEVSFRAKSVPSWMMSLVESCAISSVFNDVINENNN